MAKEAAGGRMRWWHMVRADSPVARLSVKISEAAKRKKQKKKKKNKSVELSSKR